MFFLAQDIRKFREQELSTPARQQRQRQQAQQQPKAQQGPQEQQQQQPGSTES
jgi:hypothetical protein